MGLCLSARYVVSHQLLLYCSTRFPRLTIHFCETFPPPLSILLWPFSVSPRGILIAPCPWFHQQRNQLTFDLILQLRVRQVAAILGPAPLGRGPARALACYALRLPFRFRIYISPPNNIRQSLVKSTCSARTGEELSSFIHRHEIPILTVQMRAVTSLPHASVAGGPWRQRLADVTQGFGELSLELFLYL